MDKYGEMQVFCKAAELGGFSAAARDLDLTPSAVSKLISRLEDRLGVRLFNRTTRQLKLTEEGLTFYDRSVIIINEIDQIEHDISELSGNIRGTLRVAAIAAFARMHLLRRMPGFLARYPDLKVEMELTDRHVSLIDEGIDVSVRLAEDVTDESLVFRKLAPIQRVICASADYVERHGMPETPEDLGRHNCLRHSALRHFNDWEFRSPDGNTYNFRVNGNFEVNSVSALHNAVNAGIGVARLASFVVQPDLKSGRIVQLLPNYQAEESSIMVVYPHRRHLSNKVRAFVDFLVDEFTPTPPWERSESE